MGSTIIDSDFPHDIIHRGQRDANRHNKRVDEAVRKQLKDLISQQDIITSEGNKKVKVRLKYLDQYRFRHNPDRTDEVGRDEFDDLENGELISEPGEGGGRPIRAGDQAGEELYETEYTLEELTDMMIQELELPDLDDTKKTEITSDVLEYTDRRKRVGIEACLDKKQTLLAHIKRRSQLNIKKGEILAMTQDDLRFKTWEIAREKHSNAVIFLMMDRSGCHTAGHLIETSTGWKKIENIQEGEQVISLDINSHVKVPNVVSKIFKYSAPSTMTIVTEDVVLNSTPNHRYFVYTAEGIVEKTASTLEEGDYLIYNMEALKSEKAEDDYSGSRIVYKIPIPSVDISKMSSSYAREKARLYVNGIFNCYSISSLKTLRDHKDTSIDEQKQIDEIIQNGLVLSRVKRVSKQQKCEHVYDLEVLNNHNYFVDGILSHNSMWASKIYAVKALYFWIVQFLRRRYDKVEIKFIAHDYYAKELNEKEFFTIAESGGTRVSAAYEMCRDIIKHNYPNEMWNIYCFHASDGDSWNDEAECVKIAGDIILMGANLFAYAEIDLDNYRDGSSELYKLLKKASKTKYRRLMVSTIEKMEDIMDTLRKFLKHSHETV